MYTSLKLSKTKQTRFKSFVTGENVFEKHPMAAFELTPLAVFGLEVKCTYQPS